jgi:hypothetical protein
VLSTAARNTATCADALNEIYVVDLGAELFDRTWQREHVEY